MRYHVTGRDLWQWRNGALKQAAAAQVNADEVDWLLQGLCQIDSLSLRLGAIAGRSQIASRVSLAQLEALWLQRIRDRVPIQQLVGETPWRQFTLEVSPAVLIPRPETELIIDCVLETLNNHPETDALRQGTWVDMGTGSGAISLGLADALPQAKILAVDVSAAALEIAQRNAIKNRLENRIQFLQGSWFGPLEAWRGQLAGIVSNPPYIPSETVLTLQPEVMDHEPHLALDGGTDGLDCVRQLVSHSPAFLRSGGIWVAELMIGQATTVMGMLEQTGDYQNVRPHQDLAKIDRFVVAQRRPDVKAG